MWQRYSAETHADTIHINHVHIKHHNGEMTKYGLCDFDHGIVCGARQAGWSISEAEN